jgi:molybdopterin converting factor small subunit
VRITLKLFASLGDLLPSGAKSNAIEIDVDESTTLNQIIQRYSIPPELAHLVLINGVYSYPADRDSALLKAGDVLAIWPPVAGG